MFISPQFAPYTADGAKPLNLSAYWMSATMDTRLEDVAIISELKVTLFR